MEDVLSPFRTQIEMIQQQEKADVIEHAILLWNIIYSRVLHYQKKFPNWLYLKHEDLSRNPVAEFKALYKKLGLTFNDQAKSFLKNTTQGQGIEGVNRNARLNINKWTWKLSEEEIHRVFVGTEEVAAHFYGVEDWTKQIF